MARTIGSEGARTEAAIREAAARLFARHGFEGVSMRRLAEDVGVQAGALYRYFPTKQALLADMMADHLRRLLDAWEAEPKPSADPPAELAAFARFHVRYHVVRRDEVFVNYMELRSLAPDHVPEIVRLRDAYEAPLRDILARGARAGQFHIPDLPVAAMALVAMLTGVTTWARPGGRLDADALADLHATLALGAVRAPQPEPSCFTPA